MSTTTSQAAIASSNVVISSKSAGSLSNGFGFSSGSLEILIHTRRKRSIRSQNTIVAAILDACRTPSVQHWIMVRARLGYDTFWHHMNRLLSQGMMETTSEGNKTLYRVNAKGLSFLQQLEIG